MSSPRGSVSLRIRDESRRVGFGKFWLFAQVFSCGERILIYFTLIIGVIIIIIIAVLVLLENLDTFNTNTFTTIITSFSNIRFLSNTVPTIVIDK